MRPYNYGILWRINYLKFYIDNIKLIFPRWAISNVENWPFSGSFYFLMNIAVEGDWGGLEGVDDNIFPAIMEVDYVRVYQVK